MPVAPRFRTILCAALALAVLLHGGGRSVAHAQSAWPPATILWQAAPGADPYTNISPHLVTDPAGTVHLAWLNFPTAAGNASGEVVVNYSRWDGQGWTTPVDIFAAAGVGALGGPVLLPTDDGYLHILWLSGIRMVHSAAWAADAARPQAWSEPTVVTAFPRQLFSAFDAAVDAAGRFHAVVVERPGDAYYIRSENHGTTWSDPIAITDVRRSGSDITAWLPKIAVAPAGRIHVVWSEASTANDVGTARVKYAFSADDGATWSEPLEFGGPAHSDANVAAFDGDNVYVAWNAGAATSGGRFFRYSRDGGVTWSDRIQFSQRAGLANYPSIVQDSIGRLHLLTGEGEYAVWDGINFAPPAPLSPVQIQTERSRLAVSAGNVLVAVFPPDDGIVYTAVRQLDVPAAPVRTPAPRVEATPQGVMVEAPAVATEAPAAAPTARAAGDLNAGGRAPSGSGAAPILLSTASALAVILLVLSRSFRERSKRNQR